MSQSYDELGEKLSMTEIIRLQDMLSKALVRRFEKRLALAFSDVAGSTAYFSKYGDEAGRKLQQRHIDLIQRVLPKADGRIVDTAGDGAFLCFPALNGAARAMVELQRQISIDNDSRPAEHRLQVRIGLHFGPALTDGTLVSGDSVNFSARVASSAALSEIRLSIAAYHELSDVALRLRCRRQKAVSLKGIDGPVELYVLDWLDPTIFPSSVRIDDGSEVKLPARDVILESSDATSSNRISRWHFELHRKSTGFTLRSVSSALTDVDGTPVQRGAEAPIRPGSKVRVGGVMTLEFLGDRWASHDATLVPAH
jgi:class 3 adenylate cyclase